MEDKIETEVLKIITAEAKIDFGKKFDKSLLNFRWDSLQHIRIIIAIEKKFKIKISTSDIGKLNDVKSIINYLKKK
tara:strand:+ start:2579 stop:2806 length:228 start_codon:yes stop_codon:yes gene_type:complete